jgi:hypothetical protein
MATNLISVPVYKINSNGVLYSNPIFRAIAFPATAITVLPVGTPDNVVNGALIYSIVKSPATGGNEYYSNLTVAQIITLANA